MVRTSAFQFRGKGHDLREVGAKLKVTTVVEGTVRKAGNRLRINAQLINTDDGYHLWSKRSDREMDDIFAIQDEIARAVVTELKVTLLGAPEAPMVARPTASLEAYASYMQGRDYRASRYNVSKASQFFEEAVRHDPAYAAAWAGIADAWFHPPMAVAGAGRTLPPWRAPRRRRPRRATDRGGNVPPRRPS